MMPRYVLQALRRRPAETLAAAVAIALAVAFLAALGSFVAQTGSRLTVRAAASVPVDWQVQVSGRPGSDGGPASAGTVPGLRRCGPSTTPGCPA